MHKSVLNSPRLLELRRKRRKILAKKIFFLTFFFVLVLAGFSFLSKWERLNIDNIQVSGNKVIETKMIEDIAREKISGYYLWFFPKTNFLLYPRGEIQKELTNQFKILKDINLTVRNFKTLNISVNERTALYTYCGAVTGTETDSSQKCYFMDEDGYIFDEAPYFSGEVYSKFYGTIASVDLPTGQAGNPLGSYFFQPDFAKLTSFKKTIQEIGLKPAVFFVQDNGDIIMYLSSSFGSQMGPEIKFKKDSDFGKVVENLQSVLTTEPMQTDFKNKYSSLLYIDLRFGNKVYYKFR